MKDQEFEEIEISQDDEEMIMAMSRDPEIYENIRKSIAPSIYGYEDVKEALGLQLVSGFEKNLPDGARIRGDIHILLVGDPGIAKSQLLRYMIKISPRRHLYLREKFHLCRNSTARPSRTSWATAAGPSRRAPWFWRIRA